MGNIFYGFGGKRTDGIIRMLLPKEYYCDGSFLDKVPELFAHFENARGSKDRKKDE